MKIGIVIAVAKELTCFLNSKFNVETIDDGVRITYKVNTVKNEVFVTTSGYGKIDASSATQYLITRYGVEVMLNYGVTGALSPELKVKDLFIVEKTINYDYDISQIEQVKAHQYLGYENEYIPLNKNLINFVKQIYPSSKPATVASGDRFIEKREDKDYLYKVLGCDICDMEIAGIAKTCDINKIPCLAIKCISDTLDGTGQDFHKNVEYSASLAFDMIQQIIEKL